MGQFFEELKRRNVLRVAIAYLAASWLLIQLVETLFPIFDLSAGLIRLVVILVAIGFPLVLIFSWLYELTAEGIRLEREIERSASMVRHTGKRLDRAIIVVLVLALGYFAVDKFVLSESREASIAESARLEGRSDALVESYGDNSIAVLPFVNMSDDANNEYFSDGISEELLNLLAKIPDLRVISRTSAFSFKAQDLEIPEIARRLNVEHILEGSVRKDGDQVRVTAQLIEARSDTHLWSDTWDRSLEDIFSVQDEIAAEVVSQLKVQMLGASPITEVTNPEAYALYLQARYVTELGTPESYSNAVKLYQRALAIDPEYTPAWNGLSTVHFNQAGRSLPWDEGLRLAREAAIQALSLNPNIADVHKNLGWVAVYYEGDLEAAARHFQRAATLSPKNLGYLSDAAAMYQFLTRFDDAIAIRKYLITRNPTRASYFYNLGGALLYANQLDEAITSFRTALTLSPSIVDASFNICVAQLMKGDPELALAALKEESDGNSHLSIRSMAYHALGRSAESEAVLVQMIEENSRDKALAYVHAFRGEIDQAFNLLNAEYEQNGKGSFFNVAGEPLLKNLHSDPRWLPFLEMIGRSPEQLANIEFNVFVPD